MKIKPTPLFLISLLLVLIATLTPGNGKIAGNYLDKVAHFLLFAFLAYQSLKALIHKKENTEIIIWTVLLGFLTEYLQQFIPGRNMDFYDALADSIGVFCAFYLYKYQYSEKK